MYLHCNLPQIELIRLENTTNFIQVEVQIHFIAFTMQSVRSYLYFQIQLKVPFCKYEIFVFLLENYKKYVHMQQCPGSKPNMIKIMLVSYYGILGHYILQKGFKAPLESSENHLVTSKQLGHVLDYRKYKKSTNTLYCSFYIDDSVRWIVILKRRKQNKYTDNSTKIMNKAGHNSCSAYLVMALLNNIRRFLIVTQMKFIYSST